MSESKRKWVVFAIFLVAVAWGIYSQPWKHFGSSSSYQEEIDSSNTVGILAAAVATVASAVERPTVTAMAEEWTVDPFRIRKLANTSVVPVRLTEMEPEPLPLLQGMMTVGNEPVCVIGGQIVKKGDRVGEWRVDAIASDRVEVGRVSDGRRLTLRVGDNDGNKRR
jgi:hypothetical protein